MKILLFIFLTLITISGFAQLPPDLRYDAIAYSSDSATAIVITGKKSAVYNLQEGKFTIAPTKNQIVNFPGSNHYFERVNKTGQLIIHLIDGQKTTTITGDSSSCYIGFANPGTQTTLADVNERILDLSLNDTTAQTNEPDFTWSRFGVQKMHDGIYNMTSFEANSFNGSGIVDLTRKEWLIEPIYRQCFEVNGFLFCLRETVSAPYFDRRDGRAETEITYSYDLYELTENGTNQHNSLTGPVAPDLLALVLGVDSVYADSDSTFFTTVKDGKIGFVMLRLFEDKTQKTPAFCFRNYLEPVTDFLLYQPHYQKLACVFSDSSQFIFLYHVNTESDDLVCIGKESDFVHYYRWTHSPVLKEGLVTSSQHFEITSDSLKRISLKPTDQDVAGYLSEFGISRVNDSVINVLNFYPGGRLTAFKSKIYPDEDSITSDGLIPYYHIPDVFGKSGLYNLKTHNWLIEPVYERIYEGSGKFVCFDLMNEFSFFDSLGNLEFSGVSGGEVYQNPEYLKWLAPYKNPERIYEAPNGFWHHHQLKEVDPAYYVELQNELGLYKPGAYDFLNEFPKITGEFVHYNPSLKFTFVLDKDSIHFLKDGQTYAVSRQYGKISYVQPDLHGDAAADFELKLIEKTDTIIIGNCPPGYDSYTFAGIELKNDLMLVNDHTTFVENSCVECYDQVLGFINFSEGHFESENSAVWKNTGSAWQKISPYYATIQQVSNGWFIASSGHFFKEYQVSGSTGEPELMNLPARYFLLDSNFKAVPFLDYFDFPHIEDLGFGIKIKLDNGYYFFMTYDGLAVTNAEWHDFELENGKLKAILHTTYLYDDQGNPVLDEFGLPVEATTETVKYFKWP